MSAQLSNKNIRKLVLGKAQAREQFSPLVEALAITSTKVVEVTDYGKVAAVIMSHKYYLWLLAQAKLSFKPKRQLCGSMSLVSDIEEASREISESIHGSIQKSARRV